MEGLCAAVYNRYEHVQSEKTLIPTPSRYPRPCCARPPCATRTAPTLPHMTDQHQSRRATAAAAAAAHLVVPINSKSTRKRSQSNQNDSTKPNRGVKTPLRRPAPPSDEGVLHPHGEIDADEQYGQEEKALSEFLKLHPMLSLCAASHQPPATSHQPPE